MARHDDPLGPLRFPAFPDGETADLIATKLAGHCTSARWLPEGMGWPELDEPRAEHLRVRSQVKRDIDALNALLATHKAEDAGYSAALAQATRAGIAPPADDRTPPEKRSSEREAIERSIWAGARVFAEVVAKARSVLVENEAAWLASLKQGASAAKEAVREHERLLYEAKVEAWRGVRLAGWLKSEVNGGPFGYQPAPAADGGAPMPDSFDPRDHEGAFERRYYEVERVQPHPRPGDDPLALEGDEPVVEPLDEGVRFSRRAAA